jgi:hypothetical protein
MGKNFYIYEQLLLYLLAAWSLYPPVGGDIFLVKDQKIIQLI